MSGETHTFHNVAQSAKTSQEVESVTHVFKNVTFEDTVCSICQKGHKSLEYPSLRFVIEIEVSCTSLVEDNTREYQPYVDKCSDEEYRSQSNRPNNDNRYYQFSHDSRFQFDNYRK